MIKYILTIGSLLAIGTGLQGQSLSTFINEVNYLASNPNEGIEIAAPAGQNLAGWTLVEYATDGLEQETTNLSGIIPNSQNGQGVGWFEVDQSAGGGGIALVNPSGTVIQFLSYGPFGSFTANDGPANGTNSEHIGSQLIGTSSLQLTGLNGTFYEDFIWVTNLNSITPDNTNTNQSFAGLLPVSLVEFSAKPTAKGVHIFWKTDQEWNHHKFELWRAFETQGFPGGF